MASGMRHGYACLIHFPHHGDRYDYVLDSLIAKESTGSVQEKSTGMQVFSLVLEGGGTWRLDAEQVCAFEHFRVIGHVDLINWRELLECFGSDSDDSSEYSRNCRLVVLAFIKWGRVFAEHLNGNFSFSIINLQSQEIIGVRDHIGVLQFYYTFRNGWMAFSDTLSGVRLFAENSSAFNQQFIIDYLLQLFPDRDATIFSAIKALPPAHCLKVHDNQVEPFRYWHPLIHKTVVSRDDFSGSLLEIIKDSVNRRIMNKEKLAVQLSGGLDSSAVFALVQTTIAQERSSAEKAFAITRIFKEEFRDASRNEAEYAEEISRLFETQLHYCDDEIENPLEYLPNYYDLMGNLPCNPFFAITGPIYAAASAAGSRNIVTGFGGDELASMSGRIVFPMLLKRSQFVSLWKLLKQYTGIYDKLMWPTFRSMALAPLLPQIVLNIYSGIQHPGRRREESISFLRPDFRHEANKRRRNGTGVSSRGPLNIALQVSMNIHNGIIQHLLEHFAYAAIKYGVQFIHPLLDKNVMAFMSQVPPIEIIKDGWRRSLFRRAMKEVLPEKIRFRKDKSIFSLPYEGYIRASREMLFDTFASRGMAWDYLDQSRLRYWSERIYDSSEKIDNAELLSLKIALALNVAQFLEYSSRYPKNINAIRAFRTSD